MPPVGAPYTKRPPVGAPYSKRPPVENVAEFVSVTILDSKAILVVVGVLL